ncbi:MAG: glycosyltransferase [Nitrospirae bacterium]|nr:MAG: glycosyltransferase [Nitrospirota bacterium]
MAPFGKRQGSKRHRSPKGPFRKPFETQTPDFQRTLVIFAKAPIPGQVKTRLCPPLTPDEAATLHGSMVMDTIERSRALRDVTRVLACTPTHTHPFFQALGARHPIVLWDQVGDDLGARLHHAVQTACDRGARSVILVGTDLPTFQTSLATEALKMLAQYDLVIGPTLDGGYYLLALKTPAPSLFSQIPWSTDQVRAWTEQAARELGFSIGMLPMQRDLDTIDDLHAFIEELHAQQASGISTRTARVLTTLAARLLNRE